MAQVNVIGRITADLELKTSEKSNPYVRFDIAENIGSRQALHTQYFQVCAWGEDANRLMKAHAKKGRATRSTTPPMPLLWHFCVPIPIRPMKRFCPGICRSLRRSSSRHKKNWSAAANRPVGPIMRKRFHAAAQEAVKTSGVIFRKEDRILYEKRNECKRPDCISAGGRLPRRYFNRQRTHLYFACR